MLILSTLGAIAEFERDRMHERQREGIAKAKAKGKYTGRKPTAQVKAQDVMILRNDGLGPSEIAQRLGSGRTSVYRVINKISPEDGAIIIAQPHA